MRSTRVIPLLLYLLLALPCAASDDAARANPLDPTVAEQSGEEHVVAQTARAERPTASFGPLVATTTTDSDTVDATDGPVDDADDAPDAEPAEEQGETPANNTERAASPATTPAESGGAETSVAEQDARGEGVGTGGVPLGRPSDSPIFGRDGNGDAAGPSTSSWVLRTAGSLAVVIGVIIACRYGMQWIERRAGGAAGFSGSAGAPSGLVEVLARYPVSKGTKLLLLKINSRVLVVSQTGEGMRTLSEIVDPDEVASILIKTRDEEGASEASRFTELLREMERDPTVAGEASSGFRSPRRALTEMDNDGRGTPSGPTDGESALRNRLSRLGDISA